MMPQVSSGSLQKTTISNNIISLQGRGLVFPSAVRVVIVAWSAMPISLNPDEYPDPKRFYPERFLNDDLDKPLAGHWSFGMGRRGKIPPRMYFSSLLFSHLYIFISIVDHTDSSLRGLRSRNAKSLDCNLPNYILLRRLIRWG
jgi:Cytochrome P450